MRIIKRKNDITNTLLLENIEESREEDSNLSTLVEGGCKILSKFLRNEWLRNSGNLAVNLLLTLF